jgi:hypothetical protein
MEELLKGLVGKRLDVICGVNSAYQGEALDVKNGVLHLKNEDDTVIYIATEKIAAMYECKDLPLRPGFVV